MTTPISIASWKEDAGNGRDARLAALGFERFLVFEGFFFGDDGLPESEPFVLGCSLFGLTSFAIIPPATWIYHSIKSEDKGNNLEAIFSA